MAYSGTALIYFINYDALLVSQTVMIRKCIRKVFIYVDFAYRFQY
jgi:hypothetical protein